MTKAERAAKKRKRWKKSYNKAYYQVKKKWEIDHIKSVAKGDGDELDNLQPLYWKTNRQKGDTWPISPTDYCGQLAE